MPTVITLNGSVTLDESALIQNGTATTTEDNNDQDVSPGALPAAFSGRLSTLTSSAAVAGMLGAAESASNLISVTSDTTLVGLGFSAPDGTALPTYAGVATGGAASNMTAVDGGAISLFMDASLGNRMVLGVDGSNNIVFALFMEPAANFSSAKVWMAQFEPLVSPTPGASHDESLALSGLGVSAGSSLDFNFNALPSGQNLFGTVGTAGSGLVVIGKTPVLNADGTYTNTSNTINTSQGGGPTTIGVDNQMFDPGDGAYFTFVKNPVPNYLAGATGGLTQGEADDADNIQYTGGALEVTTSYTVISQTQGNSPATMRITAYNMADAPQGTAFAEALGDGTLAPITSVRVFDAAGNQVASPSVTISGGVATVAGLGAGYKVEWVTSSVHDQVLIEGVAGKFDIGRFGTNQAVSTPLALNNVRFEDDGPTMDLSGATPPMLTVDDTNYAVDATGAFSAQFTATFGSDTHAATSRTYALSTPGGASGLTDTETKQSVMLSLNGSIIEGKTATSGALVFTVSVDADGVVTLNQSRSVVHASASAPDETRTLSAANLVVLTGTAHDKDADTASAALNIGQLLQFKDDGPTIGPIPDGLVDFAIGSTTTVGLVGDVNNDPNTAPYTISSYTPSVTVNGVLVQGVLTSSDTIVTYWANTNGDAIVGNSGDTAYFRLTLGEQAAAGDYKFDVLVAPPPANLEFNFNALPSGQNLFGTVGTAASGLVVIGKVPVLNADGTFTNASNTINTSQGGGPTTIGVNNQMFDAGEGAYFTFVNNPVPNYLAGAAGGLTQGEADDADNIQYGSALEVKTGFTKISQIQGNSLATMSVAAFDMAGAPQGQDFANAVGDGLAVALTAVRVYNAAGTKVADSAGAGSPSITFSGGVATVSGLGAGFKVEWDTATVHDQVLLTGVAGKFDIGGFGTSQSAPTPDTLLNFTARVTDGDTDFAQDAFTVLVDGTGIYDDGIVTV